MSEQHQNTNNSSSAIQGDGNAGMSQVQLNFQRQQRLGDEQARSLAAGINQSERTGGAQPSIREAYRSLTAQQDLEAQARQPQIAPSRAFAPLMQETSQDFVPFYQQQNLARAAGNAATETNANPAASSQLDARRKRARQLLDSIIRLRKPQNMERLVTMSDGAKLLQTLVNTENIEKRLAQGGVQGYHGQSNTTASIGGVKTEKLETNEQDIDKEKLQMKRNETELEDSDDAKVNVATSAQQRQQDVFEIDEARRILQKRRRPMQQLVEEYSLDEIFDEEQRVLITQRKRRRLDNYRTSSNDDGVVDTTQESQQPLEDLVVPLEAAQKEALKKQLMQQCLQSGNKVISAPSLTNLEIESGQARAQTRLASLKEKCHFLFVDFLTGCPDPNKNEQAPVFLTALSKEVALAHPDLLLDVCKHWLNLVFYKLPGGQVAESQKLYTKTLKQVLEGVVAQHKHVVLHDGGVQWAEMLRGLNISQGAEGEQQRGIVCLHASRMLDPSDLRPNVIGKVYHSFLKSFCCRRNRPAITKTDQPMQQAKMFNLLPPLDQMFSLKERQEGEDVAKLTSIVKELFEGDDAVFKSLPAELQVSFIDKLQAWAEECLEASRLQSLKSLCHVLEKAWPCFNGINQRQESFLHWLVAKSIDQQRKQLNEAHQILRLAAHKVFLLSSPSMTVPYLLTELKKNDVSRDKVDLSIACLCLRQEAAGEEAFASKKQELIKAVLDNKSVPDLEKSPLIFNNLLSFEHFQKMFLMLFNETPSQQWLNLHIYFTKERHSKVLHEFQCDIIARVVASLIKREQTEANKIAGVLAQLFEAPSAKQPVKIEQNHVLVRQIMLFEELLKVKEIELLKKVIETLISAKCWQCKTLMRFVLQLGQQQGDFDWCLATVGKMLGKAAEGQDPLSSSILSLSKYNDEQYLKDNQLSQVDAHQLWEGAKKGLALFFVNMPRSDQQMRSALQLFKDQIRDKAVLEQFMIEKNQAGSIFFQLCENLKKY